MQQNECKFYVDVSILKKLIKYTYFSYNIKLNKMMLTKLPRNGQMSQNEDQQPKSLLRDLGNKERRKNWDDIAQNMDSTYLEKQATSNQSKKIRHNQIPEDEEQSNNIWTKEEEHFLFQEFLRGSKWKIISRLMVNKSQNAVKNKFYGKIRKLVRRLNNIYRQRINKSNKAIKDESILRIIDIEQKFDTLPQYLLSESMELKRQLLGLAQNQMEGYESWTLIEQNNVINLIKKVHKFNLRTRSFCTRKRKNKNKKKKIQKKDLTCQAVQTQSQVKIQDGEIYKIIPIVHIILPSFGYFEEKIQPTHCSE